MGFKEVHDDNHRSYSAFRQNLMTSDIREIPVFEGRGYPTCLYLDDRRVLIAESGSDKAEKRKLTIIDVESGERTIRQLPADVQETFLAPDGRTCAVHQWKFQGDTIRQELAVLDVVSGGWKTILTPDELPHFAVKDAATSRYPAIMVSYPDRPGTAWMICTVERPSAAATRMLINSQTGVRLPLPEKNKGEVSRFSKDGSRFFTSWRIENERETHDSRAKLLSFYRIENTGIESVNSFRWNEVHPDPAWLGNDRLLYLKRGDSDGERLPRHKRNLWEFFSDRGELWTVDIQTGQHLPFFAGNDSVPKD
jgi:hypothetical protein